MPTRPFSTHRERRVALAALAVSWLIILIYLSLLVVNLIGVLRAGTADALPLRVFAPPGSDLTLPSLPWIETLVGFFMLALVTLLLPATITLLPSSFAPPPPSPTTPHPPPPSPLPPSP